MRSPLFPLYAENAREWASREGQPCVVCQEPFRPGERVADLVNDAGPAHVAGCIDWLVRSGQGKAA